MPACASDEISADLCVIGAGSGGLSVAAAAAAFGRSVVLIEKHKMGGDCLNYGCVPSKALIAAARRAHAMRTAGAFGIATGGAARRHARRAPPHPRGDRGDRAQRPVERFTGLGVRVVLAAARFVDRRTVVAGEHRIKARRFVIATGSSPVVPPIPGLAEMPCFTNETIFDNAEPIGHLIVVGGGPIGLEIAQAYRRLGAGVTVIEALKALGKDDPELAQHVLRRLRAEGIDIREGTKVERVEGGPGKIRAHVSGDGRSEVVEGTHVLVATGRKPNISDLGLDAARIAYDKGGIKVGPGLVTSNRKVFAIGDVTGGLQFTHVANDHAGIVIRRACSTSPPKPTRGSCRG